MATAAGIGFRVHSGWAAAVALVEAAGTPMVVARRRIEMMERGARGPSQPYHAAAGLEPGEAGELVARSAAQAAELATAALCGMREDLRQLGHTVAGCGLVTASGRALPELPKILASHALIHTAEGELFRDAVRAASRECGLPLTTVRERDLWNAAAAGLGLKTAAIEGRLAEMGKAVGTPWRQDQKFAAIAAWMALRGK